LTSTRVAPSRVSLSGCLGEGVRRIEKRQVGERRTRFRRLSRQQFKTHCHSPKIVNATSLSIS
jgi:hypothetical protein